MSPIHHLTHIQAEMWRLQGLSPRDVPGVVGEQGRAGTRGQEGSSSCWHRQGAEARSLPQPAAPGSLCLHEATFLPGVSAFTSLPLKCH